MKELPAFRVTIVTEEGLRWSRAFVGRRPTKKDVMATINDDPQQLSYFAALVQEHWSEDELVHIGTYAGCASVTVGRIEVHWIEPQIVLETP